jgi:hypothetical protein
MKYRLVIFCLFFNIETSVFYHRHINAKEAFSEIESMVTAKETLTNRELTYFLILPMSGNIKSFDKTFFKDCFYLAQRAFLAQIPFLQIKS